MRRTPSRLSASLLVGIVGVSAGCNIQLAEMSGADGGAPRPAPGLDAAVDGASSLAADAAADSATSPGDDASTPTAPDASAPPPTPTTPPVVPPPPGPFNPPYALPAAGQAVLIGANTSNDITPAGYGTTNWTYTLFGSYGGGCYVADYSAGGAYVIAAAGGHNHPPLFGAALFDFADATWKRVDVPGMPARTTDVTRAETNGSPYWEVTFSGAPPFVPAPAHSYMNVLPIPSSLGGGAKGSITTVMRAAITTDPAGSHRSHKLDLATGNWSRLSSNALSDAADGQRFNVESPTIFDPLSQRYYQLPMQLHAVSNLPFLDATSWTWKAAPTWPWPSTSGGTYSAAFLDDVRRLIIVHDDAGTLRAISLDDVAAGPRTLSITGSLPGGTPNRWTFNPAEDAFYTYPGSGQQLHRLKPPATNPLTSAWTASSVTIGGAALAADVRASGGTRHYTRLFYVPALGTLAWIAGGGTKVALIRP